MDTGGKWMALTMRAMCVLSVFWAVGFPSLPSGLNRTTLVNRIISHVFRIVM